MGHMRASGCDPVFLRRPIIPGTPSLSITAAIVRELMAAYGLTCDPLIAALERIESADFCGSPADIRRVDVSAERRRERDRLRKSAERLRKSADDEALARINKTLTTSQEVSKEVRKKAPPYPPSAEIRRLNADAFDTSFWPIYPRKVAKGDAKRAFDKALLKTSLETIIEAVTRFAASCAGQDLTFIPYPASWLNAERWSDQHAATNSNHKPNTIAGGFAVIDAALDRQLAEAEARERDGAGNLETLPGLRQSAA